MRLRVPVFLIILVGILLAAGASAQDQLRRQADLGAAFEAPAWGKAGARVRSVAAGTPLARAGLQAGDVVLRINGRLLDGPLEFEAVTFALRGGETVRLETLRGTSVIEHTATLAPAPFEQLDGVEVLYDSVLSERGQRLRTIVTRPRGAAGRLPAVFFAPWLSCDSVEAPPDTTDTVNIFLHRIATRSGFVLLRVDKPGVGDSEGVCSETDFLTELAGYRAAFQALKRYPFVDAERIFILGQSNGGGYAPLVAAGEKVAGYIAINGWAKTWLEHMLEIERRRLALIGRGPGEITAAIQGYAEFYADFLIRKLTPAEVLRAKPHLVPLWYELPEHMYGRPARFYQQLQDLNLAAAWEKAGAPVLVIYGEHDWIMSREDHEVIARIVNARQPGRARFVSVPRMTHGLRVNTSDAYTFENFRTGAFHEPLVPLVIDWMKGVLAAR